MLIQDSDQQVILTYLLINNLNVVLRLPTLCQRRQLNVGPRLMSTCYSNLISSSF